MRSATTYAYFLDDDFNIIKERFDNEKGLSVSNAEDVCTYQGWMNANAELNEAKICEVPDQQTICQPFIGRCT